MHFFFSLDAGSPIAVLMGILVPCQVFVIIILKNDFTQAVVRGGAVGLLVPVVLFAVLAAENWLLVVFFYLLWIPEFILMGLGMFLGSLRSGWKPVN